MAALLALPLSVAAALAQQAAPTTIVPGSLNLTATPVGPGVFGATVVGNPAQGGALYVLYVKYSAGARSAPHTHPDERTVTVVSGTFYAGSGPKFEDAKLTALKPGSIIVIPAGAPHYGWAKEGEVILQEAGLGPSGTTMLSK
jgi:quercetin dioxygenase-like cupin family protein